MTTRSSEDGDKLPMENEYEIQEVRNGIDASPGNRLALLTREFRTLRYRSREDLVIRCIIHPDNRFQKAYTVHWTYMSEKKERINLIQSYSHAFKGFSAMLTKQEANILSRHDEMVSVFRDRILQLHTTRSWDFLEAESGLGSERAHRRASNDVIIAIIDTGIWPESPSFGDKGMTAIPPRWKGTCIEGFGFKRSNCNRKLIGARYYSGQLDSIPFSSSRSNRTHSRGFTTYAERRIVEVVQGKERADLNIGIGWRGLNDEIERFKDNMEFTKLKTKQEGVDPDDIYSQVPYEKGFQFLWLIERQIGRLAFDEFLKKYIATFKF